MLFILISHLLCQESVMEKTYQEALLWAQKKKRSDFYIMQGKRCGKTRQCQKSIDDHDAVLFPLEREKILVFVSFSMPSQSLKRLTQECEKHHATLVLRGLKDNSFRKTMIFMKEQKFNHGVEINPDLFTRYKITKVPVFLLTKDNREIARLSGNISLSFAALKLRGKS